jgi:hypothetical protein
MIVHARQRHEAAQDWKLSHKCPEQDPGTGELHHAQVVPDVSLPARDHAAAVVEPGKEPFDFQRRFARRNGRPSCVFARPRRFAAIISMPYCVMSRSSSPSLS